MFEKMRPKNKDGKLRAIVIGRVSTERQQISNIEAGYGYVEPFLKGLSDGEIIVKYLGEQGSGMLVNRATILEACDLVETGEWDVVLMEDLSKSYRNPRYIYVFVQDYVDADTRVISPGD